MNLETPKRFLPFIFLLTLLFGQPATAYIGPGAGLSIIGSVLAFFAAILIGIFGFLWFPIRRLLRNRKKAREQKSDRGSKVSDDPAKQSDDVPARKGEHDA